jgi:hypothetical protein
VSRHVARTHEESIWGIGGKYGGKVWGVMPGPSGSVARNSDHLTTQAVENVVCLVN